MAKVDFGSAVEHLFAAEVMFKGHMVSWPSSQLHPYDLIVDNGKKCFRVQVKGSDIHRDRVKFTFRKEDAGARRRYRKDEIDFIALYLLHYETWYVLPVDEAPMAATVRPGSDDCKFKKYANAWHFFD